VKFNTLSLKFTPNFILLDYYIKKDETGSTRSTHWKQEMHITFWSENFKGFNHLENVDVFARV